MASSGVVSLLLLARIERDTASDVARGVSTGPAYQAPPTYDGAIERSPCVDGCDG